MKKAPLLLLSAYLFSFSISAIGADIQVNRYTISFPQNDRVPYSGTGLTDGLPIGVGSGLTFLKKEGNDLIFATVTDRGMNADVPKMGKKESKIFVSPDFTPLLMNIRVSADYAQAYDPRPLHDAEGNISGLPLPEGLIGSTNEVALNKALQVLPGSKRGLDSEGIAPDGKGGYWICDEYGPFIIHVDATGKILERFGPHVNDGEQGIAGGLPNIIKWRQPNRGFEGLTRTPDGRIIAAVQSTLDIESKTKNNARFTRLVSFDPATGKTVMYGYPIDIDSYKKSKDAKVGDIVALDNHRILLIEQGVGKDKEMRNRIYLVDFSNASDLTSFDKQPPEFDDEDMLKERGIVLAAKTLIIDLRALGWRQEKAEGLALIDNKTLAVINDNDFGILSELLNPVVHGDKVIKDMNNYQTDGKGLLFFEGKPTETKIQIKSLDKPESENDLWIITLPQAL